MAFCCRRNANIGGSIADLFQKYCSGRKNSLESRSSGQDPTHMMEALNKSGMMSLFHTVEMLCRPIRQNFGQILYGVSSPNIVSPLVKVGTLHWRVLV